jgi:DNA-binding transcriptional regulator LsrR (DeoR family)
MLCRVTAREEIAMQEKMRQRQKNKKPAGKRAEGRKGRTEWERARSRTIVYDKRDMISIACHYLCKGHTVREIQDLVKKEYPDAKLKREDVYSLFREAAKLGWVNFRPPRTLRLATAIGDNYSWLKSVRVVHTAVLQDVARHAAKTLVGLLQAYRRERDRNEVHIGFAGGHSMRALAHAFADELCEPVRDLPRHVVFHALAAGFDPTDPTTNPNAFFTYFLYKPVLQIEPHFMGLSAPAIVTPEDLRRLKKLPDIKEAFAAAKKIDIVVTSGGVWKDGDSALRKRVEKSAQCMETLKKAKCEGDLLWRPLSRRGPIEKETEYRALTLIELSQLPAFIQARNRVLLMLAPCGACHQPKGSLLECVLNQKRPLVTDLVVDSGTASQLNLPEVEGVEH